MNTKACVALLAFWGITGAVIAGSSSAVSEPFALLARAQTRAKVPLGTFLSRYSTSQESERMPTFYSDKCGMTIIIH